MLFEGCSKGRSRAVARLHHVPGGVEVVRQHRDLQPALRVRRGVEPQRLGRAEAQELRAERAGAAGGRGGELRRGEARLEALIRPALTSIRSFIHHLSSCFHRRAMRLHGRRQRTHSASREGDRQGEKSQRTTQRSAASARSAGTEPAPRAPAGAPARARTSQIFLTGSPRRRTETRGRAGCRQGPWRRRRRRRRAWRRGARGPAGRGPAGGGGAAEAGEGTPRLSSVGVRRLDLFSGRENESRSMF